MNKHTSKIFLSIILLALYACNKNEEINEIAERIPLTISTQIQSRAIIESENFNIGDHIGVFVQNSTNTDNYSDDFINVDAVNTSNGWELGNNLYLDNESCFIYAYYPFENGNTLNDVKIDITPDAEKGQTDYLYSIDNENVSVNNPNARLNFRHALARVTFSIKLVNSENNSNLLLTAATLKNTGETNHIAIKGTMNILDGSIEPEFDRTATINLKGINKSLSAMTSQTIDFLVIPTNINSADAVELELVINSKRYAVKLPANHWEAGQQYTYPITLNISDNESEEIDPSVPAKIGDYFYSDGTWSSDYKASKTCIGIVFALSKEQDGDIDVSLQESMHGRIVALQDLEKKYAWGSNGVDVEGISNYEDPIEPIPYNDGLLIRSYLPIDGENEYRIGTNPANIPYNYTTWPTQKGSNYALTDYDGKTHTSYISDFDFPAGNACYHKTMGEIATGFWYLPSCGEMGRLAMACAIGIVSKVNQSIFEDLAVGDTENIEYYWTSTEYERDSSRVFAYNVFYGHINTRSFSPSKFDFTKETELNVRPIASF